MKNGLTGVIIGDTIFNEQYGRGIVTDTDKVNYHTTLRVQFNNVRGDVFINEDGTLWSKTPTIILDDSDRI